MPVRERIKIFRANIEAIEEEVNNFLASSEEVDDLVDMKVMETSNNTAILLCIYRKKEMVPSALAKQPQLYALKEGTVLDLLLLMKLNARIATFSAFLSINALPCTYFTCTL